MCLGVTVPGYFSALHSVALLNERAGRRMVCLLPIVTRGNSKCLCECKEAAVTNELWVAGVFDDQATMEGRSGPSNISYRKVFRVFKLI